MQPSSSSRSRKKRLGDLLPGRLMCGPGRWAGRLRRASHAAAPGGWRRKGGWMKEWNEWNGMEGTKWRTGTEEGIETRDHGRNGWTRSGLMEWRWTRRRADSGQSNPASLCALVQGVVLQKASRCARVLNKKCGSTWLAARAARPGFVRAGRFGVQPLRQPAALPARLIVFGHWGMEIPSTASTHC